PQQIEGLDLADGLRLLLSLAAEHEVATNVEPVPGDQRHGEDPVERTKVQQARKDAEPERSEEVPEIEPDDVQRRSKLSATPASPSEPEDRDAQKAHGHGAQHQRRAEDRTGADLGAPTVAREDRDERNGGLGQGRADGGEDASHDALG